ncbi:MAG: hypothetical protein ACE5JU_25275, partial [Candidatus Binatia bacterium]
MQLRIIQTALFFLIFLCFGIIQVHPQALDIVNSTGDTLLHVKNDGNVGIGTTSPAGKLHVDVDNDGDGDLFVEDSGPNKGNVGIGTTNPEGKLHIVGGADVSLAGGGNIITGSLTGANIGINQNEIMARANGQKFPLFLQAEGGDLSVHQQQPGTQFVVKDNGDVGIGTTGPGKLLHVSSATTQEGIKITAPRVELYLDDTQASSVDYSLLAGWPAAGKFAIRDMTAGADRIVIDSSGNLGIGTLSPTNILTVQQFST